jgi:LacI family transcriptional regulator
MTGLSHGRFGSEVTIDDVARAAEVSIRTVSRVLNKSNKVNRDTRARVEAAVAELGFRPSLRARGLATGRSFLMGLLHDEHNALHLADVLRGAAREASRRGYELIVHPMDEHDPLGDAVDFVQRSRVDGLLVMAPVSGLEGLADGLREAGILACALSSVSLDGYAATLLYDERAGAAQAARHLIGLGHTRIAIVCGPLDLISGRERRAGFVDALEAAGLALAGEAHGDYGFESGVVAGGELLSLDPRPTAIFAASDVMAAGVLKAAAIHGIEVPAALSVVGFDGGMFAEMLSPALTSVQRPMGDIAEAGTSRLIDLVEGVASERVFNTDILIAPSESSGSAPQMADA